MINQFIYEKADLQDIHEIAKNNITLANEIENLKLDYDAAVIGSKHLIEHPELGFYFIVKHNDQIIGQMMITYEWSDWRNKMIWWMHRIYIQSEYRQQGIFKEMLKRIKDWGEKEHIFTLRMYIHKENKDVYPIYKKTGFIELPFYIMQDKKTTDL